MTCCFEQEVIMSEGFKSLSEKFRIEAFPFKKPSYY